MKKYFAWVIITFILSVPAFASSDVSNVQISSSIDGVIDIGETATFEVTKDDEVYPGLTWETSDPSIATIDEDGVLTAKKAGTVTVVATADDGFSTTWEVQVQGGSLMARVAAGVVAITLVSAIGVMLIINFRRNKQ